MKLAVKVVAPLVALLAAATTVVAVADPAPQKDIYPEIAPNPDVCKAEKLIVDKALDLLKDKKELYADAQKLEATGTGRPEDTDKAEMAMLIAQLAYDEARYAEAICRNKASNDPLKACKTLVLELTKLKDQLPILERLAKLAWKLYNASKNNATSAEQRKLLLSDAKQRSHDVKILKQRIADKRVEAQAEPTCKGFPLDRPEERQMDPLPPKPEQPTTTTSPEQPPGL